MKTQKTNIKSHVHDALNSMSRQELRKLATRFNLRVGQNKQNTVDSIVKAIDGEKIGFKSVVTISEMPLSPTSTTIRKSVFVKKFRTYKPDKVLVHLS